METVAFGNIKIDFRSSSETGFYCEWKVENFNGMEYNVTIQTAEFYPLPNYACFLELKRPSWSRITLNLCNRVSAASEILCEVSVLRNKVKLFYSNSATIHCSKANQKIDLLCDCKLPSLNNESLIITCSIKAISVTPPCSRPLQTAYSSHDIFEATESSSLKQFSLMDTSEVFDMKSLNRLSNDFSKILEQSSFTDFTLCVEGIDIRVHKTILRARSPVFDRMLYHITGDLVHLADSIDITDIRLKVMKQFLAYLYTGTYKKASFDESCDLYYVADKYEVLTLRDSCRRDLLNLLQVSNACSLLRHANHHSDDVLKDVVMKFIHIHFKSIVETESWEELVNNHTKLASTVMRICARALSA